METNYYNYQVAIDRKFTKKLEAFGFVLFLYFSLFSLTPVFSQDVVSIDYLLGMPQNQVDVFKVDVLKIYKDNYFLYYVKYFFSNFVPPLPDIIIGGHFDDAYTDMRKSWNPSMLWGFPKLVSSFMWYLIYKCVRFRNGG